MDIKKIYIMIFLLFFGVTVAFSQISPPVEILDVVTIESFDDEITGWTVQSSESASNRFLGQTVLLDSQIIEAWPIQLFGYDPIETRRAFGVRAGFRRRGNNYVEIIPPGGSLDLPGFVREIELWVWNVERDYSVTVQLQDFRGIYHTLELGDIDHLGWARVSARIPNYILQTRSISARIDPLRLVSLIVWTDPIERVDDFQLYFDELRVTSDIYRPRVDGEELWDPEFVQQIWGDV